MLTTLLTLYLSAAINGTQTDIAFENIMPQKTTGIEILKINPIPIKEIDVAIELTSKAVLVIDVNSEKILYEKNIHTQMPIASITKIMTAVVAIEELEDLDEVATVSYNATQTPGSKIWLIAGEEITYRSLLYGLLIPSGNDAAVAIAENVAGSEKLFVQKMNDKAIALGMKDTNFINPHGLDDDPSNLSTASDLAILVDYALNKKLIRSIVDMKEMEISSIHGTVHKLTNTNKLLGVDPEIKGLKTGSTILAGQCLIALAENPYGNEIIIILLNSQARFNEAQRLKDKIWEAYVW